MGLMPSFEGIFSKKGIKAESQPSVRILLLVHKIRKRANGLLVEK